MDIIGYDRDLHEIYLFQSANCNVELTKISLDQLWYFQQNLIIRSNSHLGNLQFKTFRLCAMSLHRTRSTADDTLPETGSRPPVIPERLGSSQMCAQPRCTPQKHHYFNDVFYPKTRNRHPTPRLTALQVRTPDRTITIFTCQELPRGESAT